MSFLKRREIPLEERDFRQLVIYLDLEFDYCISPKEAGISGDGRSLSYKIREVIFKR